MANEQWQWANAIQKHKAVSCFCCSLLTALIYTTNTVLVWISLLQFGVLFQKYKRVQFFSGYKQTSLSTVADGRSQQEVAYWRRRCWWYLLAARESTASRASLAFHHRRVSVHRVAAMTETRTSLLLYSHICINFTRNAYLSAAGFEIHPKIPNISDLFSSLNSERK